MTVFIDTGVFVAYRNKRDSYNKIADTLIRDALKGEYGQLYTSDYIYDESVTLALVRTKNPDVVKDVSDTILSPRIEMIFVGEALFENAIKIFMKYFDRNISFTDATSIAVMGEYNIDHILSFDSHFDGIVERIR